MSYTGQFRDIMSGSYCFDTDILRPLCLAFSQNAAAHTSVMLKIWLPLKAKNVLLFLALYIFLKESLQEKYGWENVDHIFFYIIYDLALTPCKVQLIQTKTEILHMQNHSTFLLTVLIFKFNH